MSQPQRALIVIDVQNEYVTGNLPIEFPNVNLSLANIGNTMDAARKEGIPIIVVQQYAPADFPVFAQGSNGWELHDVVSSRTWEHYIEKKFPSAFTETDLADYLSENKIDTLTVTGYMTHNCIDSTIKHAFHAGIEVEFLSDAAGSLPYTNKAGTTSAEEIHRTFSIVMQSNFAAVMNSDEWVNLLLTNKTAERDNILNSNQSARSIKIIEKNSNNNLTR